MTCSITTDHGVVLLQPMADAIETRRQSNPSRMPTIHDSAIGNSIFNCMDPCVDATLKAFESCHSEEELIDALSSIPTAANKDCPELVQFAYAVGIAHTLIEKGWVP